MRGAGKGLVGAARIPHAQREADVSGCRLPDRRSACGRSAGQAGDVWQFLIVDFDQIGGVARLCQSFGHTKCNTVANMPDNVFGQEGARCAIAFRPAGVLGHEQRRQTSEPVSRDVFAGEHGKHARGIESLGGID